MHTARRITPSQLDPVLMSRLDLEPAMATASKTNFSPDHHQFANAADLRMPGIL